MTSRLPPKALLARHGLRPKKKFGQHFLGDPNLLKKIANLVGTNPATGARLPVVEIGPGLGALTNELAQVSPNVVAVERDPALVPVLAAELARHGHVTLTQGDALDFDFAALGDGPWSVVGNLPYQITSPLLLRFCHLPARFVEAIFMVQLEVAKRLAAPPATPDYGALTVAVASRADVELCFIVGRGAFLPPPKVDSAVIRLRRRAVAAVEPALFSLYEHVVRSAFSQRRKTLWNGLRGAHLGKAPLLSDAALRQAFGDCGIDPGRRGETLSPADFARLASALAARGARA